MTHDLNLNLSSIYYSLKNLKWVTMFESMEPYVFALLKFEDIRIFLILM